YNQQQEKVMTVNLPKAEYLTILKNTYQGDIPPNSQVGPWELGYLGVLPIINPEVIQLGLKLAAALKMKISPTILFDRKIYNYFDLPKGYQITQQELPFANSGYLPIIAANEIKKVPVKILQLEEDTAKSTYSQAEIKLDFNRAGNPLIELVTEPVFQQVETVLIFIKQLQNLLRYLGISQAKLEQGQLRVDLNFSLQLGDNYGTPGYGIKNLNALANIERAQTLGFDENKQVTIIHREKTSYYYLPEELKEIDLETANKLLKNPPLLKIFNVLEKKKFLVKEEYKGWLTFYLNYLTANIGDGEEKKLDNEEIKLIIKELTETKKTFALLVKKYEKKVAVNENLIEKELRNLWSDELSQMISVNRQKVQNYLLGQVRKNFPDYSVKEIILIITNFLEKNKVVLIVGWFLPGKMAFSILERELKKVEEKWRKK
ncbi:2506_t:CDS:2, partial [Entrophospora sp. SA101]